MPITEEVEVCVFRPNQNDDEILIEVTVPGEPGRRLHIVLAPAAFALALTGRGAIKGKMREHVFAKSKRKAGA